MHTILSKKKSINAKEEGELICLRDLNIRN